MHKAKIAERLLSLVMEPEQSAAVVGDLLETGASHNVAWFWLNLFQTWVATVWRDCRVQPLFVIWLAIRGLLVQFGFAMLFAMCTAMVALPVVGLFWRNLLGRLQHPSELVVGFLVIGVLSAFYAGRWIAQRSGGKDIPVCVAMILVKPIVNVGFTAVSGLIFWLFHSHDAMRKFTFVGWHWSDLIALAACIVGASVVRRRRQIAGAC